jgi:hypothetical protein
MARANNISYFRPKPEIFRAAYLLHALCVCVGRICPPVGGTASVPGERERPATLIWHYLRWSASLNLNRQRQRTWPGYGNGVEWGMGLFVAGLEARALPKDGAPRPMPGLVLGAAAKTHDLRAKNTRARPQPPGASRRHGGGAEEPAPVPVGVTGHRTQRPPPDHTQPRPAPPWTQGTNGGQYHRLWPL